MSNPTIFERTPIFFSNLLDTVQGYSQNLGSAQEMSSFLWNGTGTLICKSATLARKISPISWNHTTFKTSDDDERSPSILGSTVYTTLAIWHAGLFGVESLSKMTSGALAYLNRFELTTSPVTLALTTSLEFDLTIKYVKTARCYFPLQLEPHYFKAISENSFVTFAAEGLYFVSYKIQQLAFISIKSLVSLIGIFYEKEVEEIKNDLALETYFNDKISILNSHIGDSQTSASNAYKKCPSIREIFNNFSQFIKDCYYPKAADQA